MVELTADELAERWAEALRSGDYKQGTGTLRQKHPNGDQWCCLGVLVEELRTLGAYDAQWKELGSSYYSIHDADSSLPEEVQALLGVDPEGTYERAWFVHLNDTERLTFDEIADVIEDMDPRELFPALPQPQPKRSEHVSSHRHATGFGYHRLI